jgi:hypothetical protein
MHHPDQAKPTLEQMLQQIFWNTSIPFPFPNMSLSLHTDNSILLSLIHNAFSDALITVFSYLFFQYLNNKAHTAAVSEVHDERESRDWGNSSSRVWLHIKQEVLGRTNRLLSFDTTRTAQKMTVPTILRCRGNVFTELLPSNDRGIHGRTNIHESNNYSIITSIRCRGNVFTEPLPSNGSMDTLCKVFA